MSQGYKSGVISQIGATSTTQYAPAVQEKVIAYEAGVKSDLFDRLAHLNLAGFYYDYSNKQVRGRVLDSLYGLFEKMVNVPSSYIWGIEGDIEVRPFSGVTLTGAATYLKSKVNTRFSNTADGTPIYNAGGYTGDFSGSKLPFTPTFSANADIQYDWNLTSELNAFVGSGMRYQSSENTTFQTSSLPANDFNINGYATFDARLGLRKANGSWSLMFYGHNIFNKFYTASINSYQDVTFRMTGRPAVYGVNFKMNFK